MNAVQFHIPDWTVATRHLSRVERSIYFDLLCLYYDSEKPLPADNIDRLAKRVMAHTEDEREALLSVLGEFFSCTAGVYRHHRCDEEIDRVHKMVAKKSAAGKASARARRKMGTTTPPAEHPLNRCSTHEQQPDTRNPIPDTHTDYCAEPEGSTPPAPAVIQDNSPAIMGLPTNKYGNQGEEYPVTENALNELVELYPAVDAMQTLRNARGWLVANPTKRKTASGMPRFLNTWFAKEQDRGGGGGRGSPPPATRRTTLQDDLSDTSWAS